MMIIAFSFYVKNARITTGSASLENLQTKQSTGNFIGALHLVRVRVRADCSDEISNGVSYPGDFAGSIDRLADQKLALMP